MASGSAPASGGGAAKSMDGSTMANDTVTSSLPSVAEFYPQLQPFVYSLDTFTPLIDLGQADYWLPNSQRGETFSLGPMSVTTGGLLRSYLWFHILAGWVLSTLLFVGLTGSIPGA
jgi:hypothetical protein